MNYRIFVLLALVCSLALAQDSTPRATRGRQRTVITRQDIAEALIRVEQTLLAHPPSGQRRAQVHRAMDEAVYQFFTSNFAASIRQMNELVQSLMPPEEQHEAADVIRSLKVGISPPIAIKGFPSLFNVRMFRLYDLPIEREIELRLIIRADGPDGRGKIILEQPLVLRPDAPLPNIATKQPDADVGRYRVQIIGPDGHAHDFGNWFIVERSLDWIRGNNERRLMNVEIKTATIAQALMACRSRNALLRDRPDEGDSSQFLADPIELPKQVNDEIEALHAGKDPYVRRAGDYWRAIPAGSMHIPARIYAPDSVKDEKPIPLVIALHGAGGDESLFMEAYGAGAIKRLADKHRFIVVSASTYWTMPNPQALEGIVETMQADYSIDASRVYVIGHSLGALTGGHIASRHPRAVAGVALISGAQDFDLVSTLCPTRIIAAEFDPIVSAEKLRKIAESARRGNLPVEFIVEKQAGHALVVNEVLPATVEWLLALPPASQPLKPAERE